MKTEKMKIISPIAIDMGAKNTGVYLNHFVQGEDPTTSDNIAGRTIVIDSTNITWSQVNRTQKRHQIRNTKRRKLAKRLLKVILTDAFQLMPTLKQLEFLMGLLNNRGYNRIETTKEQEETLQEKMVSDFFCLEIFDDINKHSLLERLSNEVVIKDSESEEKWQDVLNKKPFSLSGNKNSKFKEYLKDQGRDKDEIAELSKAFTAIKNLIEKQIDNYKTGHRHRRDYLDNIRKDIDRKDSKKILKTLLDGDLTSKKLTSLIGNISNLQLRILRKYFNNDAMKSGDKWDSVKLHTLFFKWVRSWHSKQEHEKCNRKKLLELKDKDILEVFTTSDPKLSIPPYEDQNNRRPPKDLTLRLKPTGLDEPLQNWQIITQSLADNYILPQIDKRISEKVNIAEALKGNVRVQKIKSKNQDTQERQILANTLHRILDRTTILDPYKLRWLAQDSNTLEAQDAKKLLNQHSDNRANAIIELAKKYYTEVDIAKQGLWSDNESSLFFRCDTNPPHKGNIQHRLVGHILREEFPLDGETTKSKKLEEFKKECWNKKIKGKSTTKSLAGKIEETRKEYGNRFNYIAKTIQKRRWVLKKNNSTQDQKDRWNKHESDHKDIVNAITNTELIAAEINAFLGHNKKEKYNNPYSIAQLYNHLETEISGFSKTDRWNTEENAWRDEEQSIEVSNKAGEVINLTVSNASRLTADSIRPFDGMLDRIISRQAYEITRMKIEQIEALNIDKNDILFVPIFMEQNRFTFEQSLHEIKGLKNIKKEAKDRVEKGLKKQEKQWQDKDKRIKKNKHCPYTDEKIIQGEIDHIIPQSKSKKYRDVVFNSEANLIYCSGNGNHQKGDRRYSFEQLKPYYLTEIFGSSNKKKIQQEIRDFVNQLGDNDVISFHNWEEKEQNYLRHALFVDELDGKTFPILNTRYKTFVNGTQGYLGKQIRKLLQEKYPEVIVKTYQISADEVSQLRTTLVEFDPDFKKQDRQGAFSHVVDAGLVLATALKNEEIAKRLTTTHLTEESEKGQWLKDLLPKNADVQHIKRKPKYRKDLSSTQIFKEGLYGERFMPILLDDKTLYYGFSLDNCHEVEPLKEPKKDTKDFDKKLHKTKEKQLKTQNEYFELLKPFLYTGSIRKKNKKSVEGDLSDNYQYTYLSVDKTKALNHLQKCAKEVCDDKEIQQAKQLEKLRYSVEKKEIKSVLLTGQGKKTFIKQLDDKKFKVSGLSLPAKRDWERLISHPVSDYNGNETTLKECFGKGEQIEIDNPKLDGFWKNLANESGLKVEYLKDNLLKKNDKGEFSKQAGIIPKGVFNEKVKTDDILKSLESSVLLQKSFGLEFKIKVDLIHQASWHQLFEEFFLLHKPKNTTEYIKRENRKEENRGSHRQVRKEYSLPIVSAPSGGFRIKRKNPLTDEEVYQVSSIAGGGYACGFSKDERGNIDMSKKGVTFNSQLKNSPNVAYTGKSHEPNIKKEHDSNIVESFGNTRELVLKSDSIQRCCLTLAESGRIGIKITINKDLFKSLCEFTDVDCNQPPPSASISFNKDTDKEEHDKFKGFLQDEQIPIPRDSANENSNKWMYKFNIQISQNDVLLEYRTSLNRGMKTAYKNGIPI